MSKSINNDKELNEAIDNGRVKLVNETAGISIYHDTETDEDWVCL